MVTLKICQDTHPLSVTNVNWYLRSCKPFFDSMIRRGKRRETISFFFSILCHVLIRFTTVAWKSCSFHHHHLFISGSCDPSDRVIFFCMKDKSGLNIIVSYNSPCTSTIMNHSNEKYESFNRKTEIVQRSIWKLRLPDQRFWINLLTKDSTFFLSNVN